MIPVKFLVQSKGIIGVNMLRIADHKPHKIEHTLRKVGEWAEKGIFTPHVSSTFKVDHIHEAHRYLENRNSMGKVVVEW